ncbi:hypothetical protein TNCT_475451 [Trichonephila clavata]|uniref:Uncharacterized protein n=1 Tax=Trichonephila clavata TaxID=2740835 RepID=A0A8X6HKC7_TRICU|nr:hypothetical protein TNCT_475451 [Trichonephila clavata]
MKYQNPKRNIPFVKLTTSSGVMTPVIPQVNNTMELCWSLFFVYRCSPESLSTVEKGGNCWILGAFNSRIACLLSEELNRSH